MAQWSSTEAAGRGVPAGNVIELHTLLRLSGGSTEQVRVASAAACESQLAGTTTALASGRESLWEASPITKIAS